MLLLLPFLMAYLLIGEELHEWLGTLLMIAMILHQILNFSWYKRLYKRPYTIGRCFMIVINIILLIDLCLLIGSGICMSRYVFSFLNIQNVSLARNIHVITSYWGYILMSVHIGMHVNQMIQPIRKQVDRFKSLKVSIKRSILGVCFLYGMYAFIKRDIGVYMTRVNSFVFFDHEEPLIYFLLDYVMVMFVFVYITYKLYTYILKRFNRSPLQKANKDK